MASLRFLAESLVHALLVALGGCWFLSPAIGSARIGRGIFKNFKEPRQRTRTFLASREMPDSG